MWISSGFHRQKETNGEIRFETSRAELEADGFKSFRLSKGKCINEMWFLNFNENRKCSGIVWARDEEVKLTKGERDWINDKGLTVYIFTSYAKDRKLIKLPYLCHPCTVSEIFREALKDEHFFPVLFRRISARLRRGASKPPGEPPESVFRTTSL